MPKSHKPSETKGGPAKKEAPAKGAESAAPTKSAKVAGGAAKAVKTGGAAGDHAPAKKTAAAKATRPSSKAAEGTATASPQATSAGTATEAEQADAGSVATKAAEQVRKTTAPKSATAASHPKKSAPSRVPDHGPAEDDQPIEAFLIEQRALLYEERSGYVRHADELKAEADSLALEHEPGDVQFDEEGGEGGTSNVDRELDLVLSAQARSAIMEIDRALLKIDAGSYGTCEQCGRPIPQARLKALPYAALCVACKSGGLSRR